jgi:hypothetical protein
MQELRLQNTRTATFHLSCIIVRRSTAEVAIQFGTRSTEDEIWHVKMARNRFTVAFQLFLVKKTRSILLASITLEQHELLLRIALLRQAWDLVLCQISVESPLLEQTV